MGKLFKIRSLIIKLSVYNSTYTFQNLQQDKLEKKGKTWKFRQKVKETPLLLSKFTEIPFTAYQQIMTAIKTALLSCHLKLSDFIPLR